MKTKLNDGTEMPKRIAERLYQAVCDAVFTSYDEISVVFYAIKGSDQSANDLGDNEGNIEAIVPISDRSYMAAFNVVNFTKLERLGIIADFQLSERIKIRDAETGDINVCYSFTVPKNASSIIRNMLREIDGGLSISRPSKDSSFGQTEACSAYQYSR